MRCMAKSDTANQHHADRAYDINEWPHMAKHTMNRTVFNKVNWY